MGVVIPVTDEFDHPQGQYVNYDTDVLLLDDLKARRHTNLRSFYADVVDAPLVMWRLGLPMGQIDTMDMNGLAGTVRLRDKEPWTAGTTGPDVAVGKRSTLRIDCVVGQNIAESVTEAVDLSVYAPTDKLSIALPNFPGSKISASSFLELEQNGTTVKLLFQNVPSTDGNAEASWNLSELGQILKPTRVRFVLVCTAPCTVRVAALRVLVPGWTPTKLDIDTVTQRLIPTVNRDGAVPTTALPKLWRAADPPGANDPRPINSRLSCNFYSGSLTGDNRISIFLRGRREDFLTQLDLDGTDTLGSNGRPLFGENQQTLEQRGRQPDYGQAVYNPRPQIDLEALKQSGLDVQVQAQLERLPDTISESWIEVAFRFGTTNQVVVGTTETTTDAERLQFAVSGLQPATQYLLSIELENTSLRVMLHRVGSAGDIAEQVFDSTAIINEFLIKRRKGRIGWEFDLIDGDAWIDSVRSRGLMFGEIITNNFESFTPVDGARLFVDGTPDVRLDTGVFGYNGPTLAPDKYNARSDDGSLKVTATPLSGIQTSFNVYEDFAQTEIVFDVWYPARALKTNDYLIAALLNTRGNLIPLVMPTLVGDQWQTVRLRPMKAINEQSGSYRFVLMQASNTQTWWVDNLSINVRSVAWAGRATLNDPWGRDNNRWTEFLGLTNSDVNGVLFPERGVWAQVRGQTLTQNAVINKVYMKPKYAELGRLIWNGPSA